MPINNDILGIYKAVYVRTSAGGTGRSYIVDTATRQISMEASPKVMITGSPKTRIMDIGGVTETVSISAPILIGGGSQADGRALANQKIAEIIDTSTAPTLPVLKTASFSITEAGATVSMTLESDGDTGVGTSSFWLQQANTPHPSLDLGNTAPTWNSGATRVARFYDFRVKIGNRQYFVQEASVDVNVETSKTYFINPYAFVNANNSYGTPIVNSVGSGGTALQSALYGSGTGISIRYGSPFPHIGINGITVSGKGKGAVVIGSNYADENIAGITTQAPGKTVLSSSDATSFALEVAADPTYTSSTGTGWTNLLFSGIGLSKSIINATNFQVSTGILTVDFDFMCYVG
jgi:hypothetical protein